jgi:hypothetical protein
VIRGGGVGDIDHCERDFPRRRGGMVIVDRRYPGLPTGGWGGPVGGRTGTICVRSPRWRAASERADTGEWGASPGRSSPGARVRPATR